MSDRGEFPPNGTDNTSSRPRGPSLPPPTTRPSTSGYVSARPKRGGEAPPGRIYVGNLPQSADRKFVEDLFGKYGSIVDVSVKKTVSGTPFAFVEYADPRDAQDAIRERDGFEVEGSLLRVETPFASRPPMRGPPRGFNARGPGMGRRGEFRVTVHGLPPSGSWQDLKDHMREAGECVFADVYRDGTGVVEFSRSEDMEYALRHFQDSKFRSHEGETSHITVTRDTGDSHRPSHNGGHGYRDDGRRPRYSSTPYPGPPPNSYHHHRDHHRSGGGGGTYDRYEAPSRGGGYDSYRGSGGGPKEYEGRAGYGPSRHRRSPSYTRRSRSRSRSYNRYR